MPVTTRIQYLQAICLMMAAQQGVIELTNDDKGFIALVLNHELK